MSRSRFGRLWVLALVALVGCAARARHCTPCAISSAPVTRFAIYDPLGAPFAAENETRGEWPAAVHGTDVGETVDFVEIIRDEQGRARERDRDYRRTFHSVRTGRIIR